MSRLGKGEIGVEVVVEGHNEVGEGPIWDGSTQRLFWVDITRRLVYWLDPETDRRGSVTVDQAVGAVVPRSSGGLLAAVENGFALIDIGTGRLEMIAEVESDNPDNRMNDGKCDSSGRFWGGTMAYDTTPGAGSLYRLSTDHSVEKILDKVTISNGLGWSPNDSRMYFIDSPTNGIDILDYEPARGEVSNRRRLIDIPPELGMPDGMTIDAEGFIWVAMWGGSAVRRYAPDGVSDLVVELPTSQITSCAFGGEDLSDLYITSATSGLSKQELEKQPSAGALFRCRPGARGLPAPPFEG